jgi:signal transduction histidine kinase
LKSIKSRLIFSYIALSLVTLLTVDIFIIISVKKYYLNSLQEILSKQAETSGKFYESYVRYDNLNNVARSLINTFRGNTNAQIQIIGTDYKVVTDSLEGNNNLQVDYPDVEKSLNGQLGIWKGTLKETGEPVLSVSYPLKSNTLIVGSIRFTTSLIDVNRSLNEIKVGLIIFTVILLSITILISLVLSSTIINPVKSMTAVAKNMAKGNFTTKIKKQYNDEIGALGEVLNYMADEITKQEKLKNEFIASISHELRTPLTSITGWAVTLERNEIEDKEKINYGLKIIEEESLRLKALVDDLLDFSKLSSGNMELRKELVDINELINYVKNQTLLRCERNKITIISELEDNIELLEADPNRLKQVLINIVDNAVKFTPANGSITLKSKLINNKLQIIVKDTGSGISKENIDKVKNKFFKGNTKNSGSGLGLAICEEIIKLHGGEFFIESEANSGTTVTIELPS